MTGGYPAAVPRRPPLRIQTTTLWIYPSQQHGRGGQGDPRYRGATPSHVVWNLLQRCTLPGQVVLDPMAGSGTTLDVARELGREALGFDLQPAHPKVAFADARELPLPGASVDFVFCDPPYGTHLRYSGRPECLGELEAHGEAYYRAMDRVFAEWYRVLRPDRCLAVYVGDSWHPKKGFAPVGVRLACLLEQRFRWVDHVVVARGNRDLERGNYHKAAVERNFFLRGFHHLLLFRKPPRGEGASRQPRRRGRA